MDKYNYFSERYKDIINDDSFLPSFNQTKELFDVILYFNPQTISYPHRYSNFNVTSTVYDDIEKLVYSHHNLEKNEEMPDCAILDIRLPA